VNFTVDDTANGVFAPGDLQWKGSMRYDPVTRIVTRDPNWTGPNWAPLYDDGPWTLGGHEPYASLAGDHKLGIAVIVMPPTDVDAGADLYEYGLIDVTQAGGGWIWRGANGTFSVPVGQTADIVAVGQIMPAFGTVDLRITIDTANLAPSPTDAGVWNTGVVVIKGSSWGWNDITLRDNGLLGDAVANDRKFTFQLSQYVGAGKQFPHRGLAAHGDRPEFVFVLAGVEYRNALGQSAVLGVTGATLAGNIWAPATISLTPAPTFNTVITVP
jgi:hypothetical protein